MDLHIYERLKQYIAQQIELDTRLGNPIHRLLLARRLIGDGGGGNDDEEVAAIRRELNIKKRTGTAKNAQRSEKPPVMAAKATQTLNFEPPQKVSFDEMLNEKPKARRAMSTEPATFQSALEMAADADTKSLQDAVRYSAQQVQSETYQRQQYYYQQYQPQYQLPKEDLYVKRLLESGIVVTPTQTLDSIFGMMNEKRLLTQTVILPLKRPDLFRNMTIQKKILMHSLPGCGKTFLVRCIAGETQLQLIYLQSSTIFNKYVGESERYLRAAFQLASQRQPCILFIDEIDAFCKSRSDSDSETNQRVKNELLQLIDGLETTRVTFIGATNLPYALDPAVRRRFDKRIFVALPDDEARRSFLATKLRVNGSVLQQFVTKTHNYNFADLNNVVNSIQALPIEKLTQAQFFRLSGGVWSVCSEHDDNARRISVTEISAAEEVQVPVITDYEKLSVLDRIHSSVTEQDMELHRKFYGEFGSE